MKKIDFVYQTQTFTMDTDFIKVKMMREIERDRI